MTPPAIMARNRSRLRINPTGSSSVFRFGPFRPRTVVGVMLRTAPAAPCGARTPPSVRRSRSWHAARRSAHCVPEQWMVVPRAELFSSRLSWMGHATAVLVESLATDRIGCRATTSMNRLALKAILTQKKVPWSCTVNHATEESCLLWNRRFVTSSAEGSRRWHILCCLIFGPRTASRLYALNRFDVDAVRQDSGGPACTGFNNTFRCVVWEKHG